jgi:hypothetical protein
VDLNFPNNCEQVTESPLEPQGRSTATNILSLFWCNPLYNNKFLFQPVEFPVICHGSSRTLMHPFRTDSRTRCGRNEVCIVRIHNEF